MSSVSVFMYNTIFFNQPYLRASEHQGTNQSAHFLCLSMSVCPLLLCLSQLMCISLFGAVESSKSVVVYLTVCSVTPDLWFFLFFIQLCTCFWWTIVSLSGSITNSRQVTKIVKSIATLIGSWTSITIIGMTTARGEHIVQWKHGPIVCVCVCDTNSFFFFIKQKKTKNLQWKPAHSLTHQSNSYDGLRYFGQLVKVTHQFHSH